MNFITQTLLNQLQLKNSQAFQFINQAINNGGDPTALIQQMLGKATPEQKQQIIQQAKNYGCPDKIINQIR